MPSQTDLDQGGTARQWVEVDMGPTIGLVRVPKRSPLLITAAGTYTLDYSTNLVEVNTSAAVIVVLPSAIDPAVPAGVLPADFAKTPITIVDIGGNPNITIKPASVAETVIDEASIQITAPYGGFSLVPSNTLKGWTNPQ